jgi:hypothetical protein
MRLVRINPGAATRTEVFPDPETGLPIIRQVQDVRPILAANVEDARNYDPRTRHPGGFRHIARIPIVVWAQMRALGIIEGMTVVDEARFLRFLSDRDVRKLRTDNGRRLA